MTTATRRTTPSTAEPDADRPLRGRRLSWDEFYKQYPTARRPAANDNRESTNAD